MMDFATVLMSFAILRIVSPFLAYNKTTPQGSGREALRRSNLMEFPPGRLPEPG